MTLKISWAKDVRTWSEKKINENYKIEITLKSFKNILSFVTQLVLKLRKIVHFFLDNILFAFEAKSNVWVKDPQTQKKFRNVEEEKNVDLQQIMHFPTKMYFLHDLVHCWTSSLLLRMKVKVWKFEFWNSF